MTLGWPQTGYKNDISFLGEFKKSSEPKTWTDPLWWADGSVCIIQGSGTNQLKYKISRIISGLPTKFQLLGHWLQPIKSNG